VAGRIVTLTTDFGTSDPFVGTMKGIILGIHPGASIVDLTHDIPPQDIRAGAFIFDTAHHYFPEGTVHVIVVDPTVGTNRRPILVQGPTASFVCPDNGLLSHVYRRAGGPVAEGEPFATSLVGLPRGWRAYHLTNHQYWHMPLSDTFHGRDIFAPVAAYLARGEDPGAMGAMIDEVTVFAAPEPIEVDGKLVGTVMAVDRFGNLVTNIPANALVRPNQDINIQVAGMRIDGLARSYAGSPTALLALIGSHGYLEIAAANRNASQILGVGTGAKVAVGRGVQLA